MITSFKIENFKGFCELELPLSRITLLGGSNNVGKTSVLDALFIFFKRYDGQALLKQLMFRGVKTVALTPDALWASFFNNFDMSRPIVLSLVADGSEQRLEIRFNTDYIMERFPLQMPANGGETPLIRTDLPSIPAGALEMRYFAAGRLEHQMRQTVQQGNLQFVGQAPAQKEFPVVQIGGRIEEVEGEAAVLFGALDIAGKQNIVLEFLQIIEPNLKSLSVITSGGISRIYGDIGLSRKIPAAYLGDGVSRLLTIVLAMANLPDGLLLIDEIENGLHHSVMEKVWEAIGRAAREFNCQIIATTHSFEMMEKALTGLGESYRDDFAFIRLDRRGDCVRPVHINYERLETAFEYNMEMR